jgi:hypothetical protein
MEAMVFYPQEQSLQAQDLTQLDLLVALIEVDNLVQALEADSGKYLN